MAAAIGAVLVGEVGCSQTLERHAERHVLDEAAAEVQVERLLLQRPVERRLRGSVWAISMPRSSARSCGTTSLTTPHYVND
jgi:hypothetical protein